MFSVLEMITAPIRTPNELHFLFYSLPLIVNKQLQGMLMQIASLYPEFGLGFGLQLHVGFGFWFGLGPKFMLPEVYSVCSAHNLRDASVLKYLKFQDQK